MLEQVFGSTEKKCEAMEGLIKELSEVAMNAINVEAAHQEA